MILSFFRGFISHSKYRIIYKDMKIAFLSFYSGVRERGVEVWVKELSKRLVGSCEVYVYQVGKEIQESFFKHTPLEVDWQAKSLGGIVRRLYLDYYSRKIYSFTRRVLSEIDKESIDILIPTNGGWQTLLCRLFTRVRGKKLIVVGHSGIGWDDFINILIGPDVFVALTDYQKKWAQKISFGVRIEKIPDGVNLNEFSPKGARIKLPLERPIILLVSALQPGKRVDLAIKAVSRLKEGSLVVLGEGTEKETRKIEELADKLLAGRFLLTSVPHHEMPLWYRTADIITFPSWRREAFGIVLIEAMACNKPVVTTNDPGKREIVGSAGYFCNPANTEEYAATLKKCLKTDFGNLPLREAQKFSWENVAKKYEELFKSL